MTGRGREYASALFELGLEKNSLNEMSEGLSVIDEVLKATPEYIDLMLSPAIPKEERIELIYKSFAGVVNDDLVSFLCVLTEKRHVRDFPECMNSFDELYKESMKISEATVISAVELTNAEKDKLRKTLEKKSGHSVNIEYKTDRKLIGGIIVEMDGNRMDGSLKHRLKEIKEVLKQ